MPDDNNVLCCAARLRGFSSLNFAIRRYVGRFAEPMREIELPPKVNAA
jgi:hypothetical protein